MIETNVRYLPLPSSADAAFLVESANIFHRALHKIEHCLKQLDDEQVNWRPFDEQNSIANIILHLCGNVRQWIINGLTQNPDVRDRKGEFSDRATYTRDELLKRLRAVVDEAAATLAGVPADQILASRTIQGFKTSVLQAVYDTTSHFVGHAHQIVWITRGHLREKYVFDFVPA